MSECLFYSNVQKGISSLTGSLQFLPKMCEMEENLHLDLFFSCLNKWMARILPGVFPLMEQMAKVPSTLEAQDTQLAS